MKLLFPSQIPMYTASRTRLSDFPSITRLSAGLSALYKLYAKNNIKINNNNNDARKTHIFYIFFSFAIKCTTRKEINKNHSNTLNSTTVVCVLWQERHKMFTVLAGKIACNVKTNTNRCENEGSVKRKGDGVAAIPLRRQRRFISYSELNWNWIREHFPLVRGGSRHCWNATRQWKWHIRSRAIFNACSRSKREIERERERVRASIHSSTYKRHRASTLAFFFDSSFFLFSAISCIRTHTRSNAPLS